MELEWAWKPDFCCGRSKSGGSFDVLGDEEEEGSAGEEEVYGDDENEESAIEDMSLEMEHRCQFMRRTSQDSTASYSRLPHSSMRWLKQRVPEHTLRHIESLLNHLHTSGSNSERIVDDRIGVLHLPSPFHRAILHAVCKWWGASSKSEYRRGVHDIHSHVVVDERRKVGVNGTDETNEPLHRVTVIGRGRIPTMFLADKLFGHVNDPKGDKEEG